MEPRRLLLFFALSLAIMIGWTKFVIPLLDPPVDENNKPAAEVVDDGDMDAAEADDGKPGVDDADAAVVKAPQEDKEPDKAGDESKKPEIVKPKQHPLQEVVLGSLDPETGYFAAVRTISTGAAIDSFTLNDKRYKSLVDPPPNQPREQLDLVQTATVDGRAVRTLETAVPQIDSQLKQFQLKLNDLDWEVAETIADPQNQAITQSVTYKYVSPDGKLEIRKSYRLERIDIGERDPRHVRDSESAGYQLKFDVTLINHDDVPHAASYVLQGPVGLPLENIEHTSIYRSVRNGHFDTADKAIPFDQRDIELITVSAADVVEKAEENELDEWEAPFRFIGVDVQYFAALIVPETDQLQSPYISVAQPMLIDNSGDAKFRDISVSLSSVKLNLKPGAEVKHSYSLYAGPKRDPLLEPIAATGVIEYGIFGVVSRLMLSMMKFMHDTLYLPYGFAIIFLTIIVRGCMYPISRKQAAGAKKMKELQPKIAELKKKYENDKEKFARAQMELFSKHNYNPLAGCLPILMQLPIFIGLYQALRNAVDLRLTPFPFTWIDNLAAPDALFRLPFAIPFGLGHDFNLLPLLTVALFVIQQKLFMPPPADEQQALQHKMMNFMMIFMGFMFYHVPAGLCVYFIASSLWGIGERKMLDYGKPAEDSEKKTDDVETAPSGKSTKFKTQTEEQPARKGFMQKLFEAADAAAQSSQSESKSNGRSDQIGGGGRKKRKKSRR